MNKPWQGALFVCVGLTFIQATGGISEGKTSPSASRISSTSAPQATAAPEAKAAPVLGPGSSAAVDDGEDEPGGDPFQGVELSDEDPLGDLSPIDLESGEKPNITCHQLITGDLVVPSDGRANVVCDRAMEICIAYVSLKKLIKSHTVPFSEQITQNLFQHLKRETLNWRRICEITRKAYTDPDFSSVLTVDPPANKKKPQ